MTFQYHSEGKPIVLSNVHTLPQPISTLTQGTACQEDFRTRLRRKSNFPKATKDSGRGNAEFSVLLLSGPSEEVISSAGNTKAQALGKSL